MTDNVWRKIKANYHKTMIVYKTIILNWFENEDNKDNNFEEDFIIRSDIASEE